MTRYLCSTAAMGGIAHGPGPGVVPCATANLDCGLPGALSSSWQHLYAPRIRKGSLTSGCDGAWSSIKRLESRCAVRRHAAVDSTRRWRLTAAVPRSERPIRIAPSILSARFERLGAEVESGRRGRCRLDPRGRDGRPLRARTSRSARWWSRRCGASPIASLDVHLMIVEPERYVDDFAKAGADIITVHAEACTHLHRTLHQIRATGKRAGVALNPHTPEECVRYVLEQADLVLVMSVNPGFGGQGVHPDGAAQAASAAPMIDNSGARRSTSRSTAASSRARPNR